MTWNGPVHDSEVVPGDGSQQELINEAIEVLEEAVSDNTAFLWTGGKEANVIADLLLYNIANSREKSNVPFVVIDTGNHFDEMYEFRTDYTTPTGDVGVNTRGPPTGIERVIQLKYDTMLDEIINNEWDARGYHGEYNVWSCPECGATVSTPKNGILECIPCGHTEKLTELQRVNITKEEWGIPESCGALKVVPMNRLIENKGYSKLITGRRSTDPLIQGEEEDDLDLVVERTEPTPHVRYNPLANWEESNIYAYIKQETVSLCKLYTEEGYRHTDAKCCTDSSEVGEYGEGGRDPGKERAAGRLEQMGYV